MGKINLVLCLHNHQPVGNFDFVFEDAYKSSYLPFLNEYKNFKDIPIVLHYSGCLIDWIEEKHPEYIDSLSELVATGNVEMMGGGYFEPIMPMLAERDRILQIKTMSDYLKNRLNTEAQGFWLAERVWEQSLVSSFYKAGVKYTVVDDFHFKLAGLKDEELLGYYFTEDQGNLISIFNGSEKLRYLIPFSDPEDVIEYIYKCSDEKGDKILVYADDGEKFGVWPGTYDLVYKRKWLERFFTLLRNNNENIEIMTFRDILAKFKPLGKIYLPDASYREMMEWVLPVHSGRLYAEGMEKMKDIEDWERYKLFYRGGFYRNFRVKYPEANLMYSKMMEVSDIIENSRSKEAKKYFLQGQCNCPYWHGVFGGLYLNHLRFATYKNLIKAEKLVRKEKFYYKIKDFDFDGHDEIAVSNEIYKIYIKPSNGGMIYEMDLFEKETNIMDNLSRREETYHEEIQGAVIDKQLSEGKSIHELSRKVSEETKKALIYDNYFRKSLIDHIFTNDITLDQINRNEYREVIDLFTREYQTKCSQRKDTITVKLLNNNDYIKINKEISVEKETNLLIVKYKLKNESQEFRNFKFGVEFNYNFLAGDAPDRYYFIQEKDDKFKLQKQTLLKNTDNLNFIDEWQNIYLKMESDLNADIYIVPVRTVSQSEAGYDLVYQSTTAFFVYDLEIKQGKECNFTIKTKIESFN